MTFPRSRSARARFFADHGGVCALCGGQIDGAREGWDIDHVIPRCLGGTDDPDNLQLVHTKCHRGSAGKTARDREVLAKSDSVRARHDGSKAPSRRPLPFSRKDPLKRKLSGEVVRRDA